MNEHDDKKNRLIGFAIIGSIVWFFCVLSIVLFWTSQPVSVQFHPSRMGLNDIGDFVAGAASPLALLWLVVTVWLQRENLGETKRQFDISQANQNRLALFDKRFTVKQQIHEARALLVMDESSAKGRSLIIAAIETADYLFGSALNAELNDLQIKARRLHILDLQYRRLQPKESRTPAEESALQQGIDELHEITMWLIETLTPARITEMFRPYLQMPEPETRVDLS